MNKLFHLVAITCMGMSLTLTGCKKKNKGVWEDTSTVSSTHRSLWGNEDMDDSFIGPAQSDFVSLKDEDLRAQFADHAVPQPAFAPGEAGSNLPSHALFSNPSGKLASIFRQVYFNTDEYTVKNRDTLAALDTIATYLKEHSQVFVYIEGYCDERGAEAYNLSLGSRRANFIRSHLVQKGVHPDQLHTISFGKEKPADLGHNGDAWARNRRAEFKIYQK